MEKSRRKIEGDLRVSQEAVAELERNKAELAQSIQRKEREFSAIMAKIEDEASLGGKQQKQIKELTVRTKMVDSQRNLTGKLLFLQDRIEELDEELELERGSRGKAEKSRQILTRELEDIAAKLEESGNATATQIELNRKREAELARLKEELESHALQHESVLASLRQKHNSVIADLGDQIDQMNKAKAKVEQQKNSMLMEKNEMMAAVEDLTVEKV